MTYLGVSINRSTFCVWAKSAGWFSYKNTVDKK